MISFMENTLTINGKTIFFERKIKKVIDLSEMILILLDEAFQDNQEITSNLFLYSKIGERIWEAELPKEMPYSTYKPEPYEDIYSPDGNSYLKKDEIDASSFRWYCILDLLTGKIKERHINK